MDPITLQVMVGGLRAVCEEMGAVLIGSSHSPNIKERRDCSTALFDASGEMAIQAEHIPVHLGSMPEAVAAILDREQAPGDAWILNDPYQGGTHLPDITLINPVFAGRSLLGFVASRAHHADVGGPTPGGMPANSIRLQDEGLIIPRPEQTMRPYANSRPRCAPRASGSPTSAPKPPPTGSARSASTNWPSATAWISCGPAWPRHSTTPSGECGRR